MLLELAVYSIAQSHELRAGGYRLISLHAHDPLPRSSLEQLVQLTFFQGVSCHRGWDQRLQSHRGLAVNPRQLCDLKSVHSPLLACFLTYGLGVKQQPVPAGVIVRIKRDRACGMHQKSARYIASTKSWACICINMSLCHQNVLSTSIRYVFIHRFI